MDAIQPVMDAKTGEESANICFNHTPDIGQALAKIIPAPQNLAMHHFARLLALLFYSAAPAALAADLPPGVADLAARVLPSVVSIAALAPAGAATPDDGDNDGGNSALHVADDAAGDVVPPPKDVESLGAGFVFDPAGYILTNNHVVDNATQVMVTFQDGTVYPASIAGRDKDADLAVLKIAAGHSLPALAFGDSSRLRVGDWVLAIGNPFGLAGSTSAGIVSALHRQIQDTAYDDFIQTDAAINRGNSGGPLFNMAGEVVGVDSAIESPGGNSDGVGFAIPSAMAQPVAEALAHTGVMRRGWLGVASAEVTPQVQAALGVPLPGGALVGAVSPNGPSAGVLQPGDVLVGLGGVALADPRALMIRTAEIPAGKTVVARFYRDGGIGQADVTVGTPPPPLDESINIPAPPPPPPVILSALGLGLAGKPADGGAAVLSVSGAALKAGIVAGDVIEQVNGVSIASAADVQAQVQALGAAPTVFLISGAAADGFDPGPRWIAVKP